MIIAVDEAIPYWEEAFTRLGEIRLFSGRKLRPQYIRDADALIVRSVTAVNASLLEGTSVRFVASVSAGMDHLDQKYLKSRDIYFTNAAGCNADSVCQYIITSLQVVAERKNWDLKSKSLAIIGVGNVGSRVEKEARKLGMKVLLCDPPLRDITGDSRYQSFEEVLEADILTFHVPLTMNEPYPTWHMLDQKVLDCLSDRQFLINSARGAVFDNKALRQALQEHWIGGAVLDVWEGEPRIDYSLLDLLDIGTPHIAGITLDGKIRGIEMVLKEFCSFLGVPIPWNSRLAFPAKRHIQLPSDILGGKALRWVLLEACNILQDDTNLRALRDLPVEQAAEGFDHLRNDYPLRLEFRHFVVELKDEQFELADSLKAAGFNVLQLASAVRGN